MTVATDRLESTHAGVTSQRRLAISASGLLLVGTLSTLTGFAEVVAALTAVAEFTPNGLSFSVAEVIGGLLLLWLRERLWVERSGQRRVAWLDREFASWLAIILMVIGALPVLFGFAAIVVTLTLTGRFLSVGNSLHAIWNDLALLVVPGSVWFAAARRWRSSTRHTASPRTP